MNKTFLSIVIFVTTTTGLFFIFITSYHQTFAQDTLTIKEVLEQTFSKENNEKSNNQTNENRKTGFTMGDLYPEKKLAQELANETISKELKALHKLNTEQSPEYKAKQALTYKYNELQEKYYVECIVHKESGEFKNTIDCMPWSQDNAQIQLGIKK